MPHRSHDDAEPVVNDAEVIVNDAGASVRNAGVSVQMCRTAGETLPNYGGVVPD
jgi:hypothetical protein